MKKTFFIAFFILSVAITIGYYINKKALEKNIYKNNNLAVINPNDLPEEMVDPSLLNVGFGHEIQDFSLTNQYGEKITLSHVKGNVFIAEYFFTTCPTICPIMNKQMQRVQNSFINEKNVSILSFTVHPEVDTVEQLLRYAKKHGAKKGQWHFLTGKKEKLYESARKSFFLLKPAEVKNQGDVGSDFIHTNNFVLIDKNLQIRGYYDGTNKKEVSKLITDVKTLLKEPKN